ncbi:uncharacterized protein MEPE_05371 [Melanopsichium pennsylvanicum]|uniref:ATPase, vacuolar ER assembly factor, Vma12 n=2 Tax=Melanopsichium pennsylvanicum TaxID=63383 RepID=A0AAJ4XQQ4_9BASI|nr:conserved hypothetical protein [Melanopsichium pennsylvanicum 4]SNX86662.1 uncharacterized protein MEPE_05371 [Melanopsichium pennsylvanicum]
MTKLVLSQANSQVLRRLAQQSDADYGALQSLRRALKEDQPETPKMTASSPAIPNTNSSNTELSIVLDHQVLLGIASWAQSNTPPINVDSTQLKLSSLVSGSHVYIAPKPAFHRSKELEESLVAIRRAQEQAEYSRISTSSTYNPSSYKIPSSYANISGVDPSLPLTARINSQFQTHSRFPQTSSYLDHPSQNREGEDQAWKEVQQTLSVILNIFLSTLATATAAWWASGNANVSHKVLISMMVAIVTAVAEVVLYNRYSVYVRESRKIREKRMTGSDVKNTGRGSEEFEFRPLQLTSSSAKLTITSPASLSLKQSS